MLRLIASHEPEACRVLRENGFIFSSSDVIAVGVSDEPGGLSMLLQLLAKNSIDIQYMYSIFGQSNGMAYMILRCWLRTAFNSPTPQRSALSQQIEKGRNQPCRK